MGLGLLAGLGKALMAGGKLTTLGGVVGTGALSLGSDMLANRGALQRQNLANSQNVQFWNMQNAYNTPKAQMGRLKDAGLNPNLIYGSGSANTGVAGSISPSKASPYNVKNPVPLQAVMMAAQIENYKSLTDKNNAETARITGLTPGQIANQEAVAALASLKLEIGNKTKQFEIDRIIANSDTARFQASIKTTEAEYASRGLKMDQVGQVFTALNMNPRNPEDQKLFQGLMATWFTTGIISKLLPKSLIEKIAKRFGL